MRGQSNGGSLFLEQGKKEGLPLAAGVGAQERAASWRGEKRITSLCMVIVTEKRKEGGGDGKLA